MHKLLVPVDSSKNSLRALQFAIGTANACDSFELHIVTAHEASGDNPRILAYVPLDKLEKSLKEHSEALLQPAIEMATAAGVKFTTEVLVGPVPKVIVERAEGLGCRAIVMGTRGMGMISSLVLGSVATKVIHLTKLPVTLVK
jgi:nucleotide-binding universal stress UspA family protein